METVRRERPDVVLLDIRMPDVDGLTVLRELRTMPDPPVVAMLTTFDADEYILTALHCGAAGLLLKDTEPEQLAQLMRTLAAGGVVLSPKASRSLLNSHPGAEAAVDEDAARIRLPTARERDVLVRPICRRTVSRSSSGKFVTGCTTQTSARARPVNAQVSNVGPAVG